MKGIFGLIGIGAAIAVGTTTGVNFAEWLWDNVIEDTLDNAKEKLSKKKVEEAEGA